MPETNSYANTREFEGAKFEWVSFARASFRNANFAGAKVEGLFLNTELSGPIDGLKINGVDVAPLIEAEMVRRHPELAKFASADLDEMREGLKILEQQLSDTWSRVRVLSEEARNRRVNDEWSVVETVRHLVFVVDLWVRRQAVGLQDAYHPVGLPPSHIPASPPGTPIDASARPSFDEAMQIWEGRLSEVRSLLEGLTPEHANTRHAVDAPGFPPLTETVPKRRAIAVVLREAWAHNRYVIRDLETLETSA